ncbi:MAG: MFS transporter [Parvibaculaceae bacterium]
MAQERLSTGKLIAFAGPAIPIAALGLPLSVFIPQFFAGPMGLGLGVVGTIFMIARFWDVITDPVMGAVSDQISSKWGRRRHWIVISVPILLLSVVMIFLPSKANVSPGYLFGWLILLYVGWTMLTLSHLSWGAELDDDYNQRSRIQGFREGFAILGIPLVMLIPVAIEFLSGLDHALPPFLDTIVTFTIGLLPDSYVTAEGETDLLPTQVGAMGWFVIVLLPLAVGLAILRMDERPEFKNANRPVRDEIKGVLKRLSFKRIRAALVPLKSNHALQRVVASDFFSGFAGASLGTMFLYEVRYVWDIDDWAGRLLLLYFIAGVGFVPILLKLSYRIGKHKALVAAAGFNVCFVPLILLLPPGEPLLASAMLVFLGVNVGSVTILYRAIMADVGDLDEVETGQRRTGLFYSLLTFTQKTGGAIAVGVVFWTLQTIGFQPSGENTEEAIRGLSYLFVGIPFTCNLIVVLLMWGFPIDLEKQKELRRIIDERKVEEWESDQRPIL